jgi:hypothetical protein
MAYRNYGPANGFIVDPNGFGDFKTIAAALSAASTSGFSGTIFLKPGTYTENNTLIAGVNLAAWTADGFSNSVIINGKLSYSGSGIVSITGISLQTNSDYCITVTGVSLSTVLLINCNITAVNNIALNISNSNAASSLKLTTCACFMNTNVAFFTSSSAGLIAFHYTTLAIADTSYTTASTCSAGRVLLRNCVNWGANIMTSSTAQLQIEGTTFEPGNSGIGVINTTQITHNGSGSNSFIRTSNFQGAGTASCISIGNGATLEITNSSINSSNTNAITGSGTLNYCNISFTGTGSQINTTFQNPDDTGPIIQLSGGAQILSGSGSPSGTITAPQGSLYLRIDGSSTSTRAYINTNSGTGWTAVTTAS